MAMAEISSRAIAAPCRQPSEHSGLSVAALAAWVPLVSVLAGIISLFYLAQTSDVATIGYGIQELQVQEREWMLRNEQVALELSRARSLATVEAEATGRLRMVPPERVAYLRYPSAEAIQRVQASSRGEWRDAPELEKSAVASSTDPLGPVRQSISNLLVPRIQHQR